MTIRLCFVILCEGPLYEGGKYQNLELGRGRPLGPHYKVWECLINYCAFLACDQIRGKLDLCLIWSAFGL